MQWLLYICVLFNFTMADYNDKKIEVHPFEPFLPQWARVLVLGTFPPKPERWAMPFFYPNKINDMWRIMGLVFFNDKDHFIATDGKFLLNDIKQFLKEKGIAMYDTAEKVIRERDNASDKYLRIIEPTDIVAMLTNRPTITTLVATGEKAATVAATQLGTSIPATGCFSKATIDNHEIRLYRMPSTSRAYPLALAKKAEAYRAMFHSIGLL